MGNTLEPVSASMDSVALAWAAGCMAMMLVVTVVAVETLLSACARTRLPPLTWDCCADPSSGDVIIVQSMAEADCLSITVVDTKGSVLSQASARTPSLVGTCGRACATGRGTVMVISTCGLLNEFTLQGKLVRCLPVDSGAYAVDCFENTVAVASPSGIALLKYTCGSVRIRFGKGRLAYCSSVRFTPRGDFVHAAEPVNGRVSVFTSQGQFVRHYGGEHLGRGDVDLAFAGTGSVVVSDTASGCAVLYDVFGNLTKVVAHQVQRPNVAVSGHMLAVSVLGKPSPHFISLL